MTKSIYDRRYRSLIKELKQRRRELGLAVGASRAGASRFNSMGPFGRPAGIPVMSNLAILLCRFRYRPEGSGVGADFSPDGVYRDKTLQMNGLRGKEKGAVGGWSGRRESNPYKKLGKLLFCH